MIIDPLKDDDNLYKYDDFGFIGFDLWQARRVVGLTYDIII